MSKISYEEISDSLPIEHSDPHTHITLNIPLLISALSEVVAGLTVFFSLQSRSVSSPIFTAILFIMMIVSSLYILYQLRHQLSTSWDDLQGMTGICASTLLSGFLLGVISFVYANGTQPFLYSDCSIVVIGFSLIGLLNLMRLYPTEAHNNRQRVDGKWVGAQSQIQTLQSQVQTLQHELEQAQYQIQVRLSGSQAAVPALPRIFDAITFDRSLVPPRPAQEFPEDPLSYTPVAQPNIRFFTISKTNDQRVIYNDDIFVISPNGNSFALCDGASGSQLPRSWGFFLGQQWLSRPLYDERGIPAEVLSQWLKDPRQNWAYWVFHTWQSNINARNQREKRSPIAPEAMSKIFRNGAAATLLGLMIDNNKWNATAIGDTCLFYVNSEQHTLLSMPIIHSSDFTQNPPLLSSRVDSDPSTVLPFIRCQSSSYRQNDILLMATDALSQWILLQQEQNLLNWLELLDLHDQEEFESFIIGLRQRGHIEEDDTTLVVIRL